MGPSSLPTQNQLHSVEEATLLGRRGVVGAVNAASLASIVRSLRVPSPTGGLRPRAGLHAYWLKCTEQGLEIRGPKYDEGFESDDTESTRSGGETEERAGESSSGVSDVDDISSENSLIRLPPLRELYSIRDVVFCHDDPIFPRVLVWVVNTSKRPSPGFLEALVFECKSETSVRQLCTSYQEISRRYKLEQYGLNKRSKDNNNTTTTTLSRPIKFKTNNSSEYEITKSSFTREMECVTGGFETELYAGPVIGRRRERIVRQREPPSLLFLPSQPQLDTELHKKWTPAPSPPASKTGTEEEPPKRPERRRYIRKNRNSTPSQDDTNNILRGQFVRVTVDPAPSPVLLKPQFSWMYGVPATAEMVLGGPVNGPQHVRSRRSCRSVSPTMSRRRAPPMPHRYGVENYHQQVTGTHRLAQLTQKLRDLTPVGGNSNTLKHPKKYQPQQQDLHHQQQQFTTLKPVIKKTNKRYGDMSEQPKKVTFSAYATVQVVD